MISQEKKILTINLLLFVLFVSVFTISVSYVVEQVNEKGLKQITEQIWYGKGNAPKEDTK